MTSKEALGLLVSRVQVGAYKEEMQKCFDILNEAINKLEKRDTPMKVIKTPHERLLELGFVVDDETNYIIRYVFNGLEIILYKKEKTYQTFSYLYNYNQYNYNPINLELAEILVDYLKELENDS